MRNEQMKLEFDLEETIAQRQHSNETIEAQDEWVERLFEPFFKQVETEFEK
jgi:hypothetical protein